jgi:glutathione-regulated potassium-efflux system ancillary protein KefG
MKRLLIVFAHPRYEASRVNQRLIDVARAIRNVTIVDLYEQYPTFDINVERWAMLQI